MTIRLSICIPTYNRAAFIGETLESIITQASDDVEIVVSDNASTDNTEEIVRQYSKKFTNLIYVRQPKNLGADANYMNVVASANGEYCWLFGSDDTMRDGAINEILTALQSEPAVLLSNRMLCDFNLKSQYVQEWLKGCSKPYIFDFSSDADIKRYFKSATSIGTAFSYLSSIVVRRALWNAVPMDAHFMGTAYSHVYKLMVILLRGESLIYHPEWTVFCRTGNDSFLGDGALRRVLLDIDGYTDLAETLMQNRPQAKEAFLSVLLRTYQFSSLVKIAAMSADEGIWSGVKAKFLRIGFNQNDLSRAERIGAAWWFKPNFVRRTLQELNLLIKKS